MINLAVIGIGNFGRAHLRAAKAMADEGRARFAAAADIKLGAYPEAEADLRARGVALYDSHDAMLAAHPELDLVTLPLPIPLHAKMSIACMERGKHVLVEKPPAATPDEVDQMIAASRRTGRHCGVAFQWMVGNMFLGIRNAIAAGEIGTVTDVSALCLAQRNDGYYARAPWAGRLRLGDNIVHDGTLNNPFAHQVQNLLAFAGAGQGRIAMPTTMEAELYAGHDIESEDTSAVRATLDTGATFHFYASLCTHIDWALDIRVTGTRGVITWSGGYDDDPGASITVDGETRPLPRATDGGLQEGLLRNYIDLLEGRATRLACPIEDARAFSQTIAMAFEGERVTHLHGTPYAQRVPGDTPLATTTYIADMEEIARAAFDSGKLYSELGAPWAG